MSEPEGIHAPEPQVALEGTEALLSEFVRTRHPDVREELADRYLPWAERLALRYRDRGESVDDLIQVASLGLLKAIDGFDDSRGARFESYATPTILGELRRHFRDHRWAMRVPRDLKEAIPRIREAIDQLAAEDGETPRTEEIADRTGMEEEEVLEALEASVSSRPRSLDAPVPGADPGEARELGEMVGAHDELFDETEYGVMLEERLGRLDDRDREALYLRFARDMTQTEIAERIGVSQMQVSRILSAALDVLRRPEQPADETAERAG